MTPRETVDDDRETAERQGTDHAACLLVTLECERPLAGGARVSLNKPVVELVIGRGADRELTRTSDARRCLRLPAPTMSSTHARLLRTQEGWTLEDARSRNGTFVNGKRVTSRVLQDGDVLELGRVVFTFREALVQHAAADWKDAADLSGEPVGFRTLLEDLQDRLSALKCMSSSTVPILLLGETGTGKEVLARAIHAISARRGPLVTVNCGALPPGLVEAQLFGHKKGAFSGAVSDEPGFVRLADGGTLFLDEIGEMPKASQATLLRILQEGEVVPVGSAHSVRVNLRVLAATNRPLGADGPNFRSDLYARLAGFVFSAPALRDRREDLGIVMADVLSAHLPERANKIRFTPEAALALVRYAWPRNVRELEQVLRAATVLAHHDVVGLEHLPPGIQGVGGDPSLGSHPMLREPLSQAQQVLQAEILERLREHRGNIAAVARAMGKAPAQIHRWLKRFEIEPHRFRS